MSDRDDGRFGDDSPRADDPYADDLDDLDDEELLAAWAEAERQAAEVVRHGLRGVPITVPAPDEFADAAARLRAAATAGEPAATWMLRAAGIADPDTMDDPVLIVVAVSATIVLAEDPGLPAEDAATIMSLEHPDWVGAILGLVRGGPGTSADATSIAALIASVPEVDGDHLDVDDLEAIAAAFELILPAWEAAGVVARDAGGDLELTEIGPWVLTTATFDAWDALGGGGDDGDGWRTRLAVPEDAVAEDPEVAAAVVRLLATAGPLTETELLDRLVTDGAIDVRDREMAADLVWELGGVGLMRDGRFVHLPSLAEGRTFTHRLTQLEVDEQRIATTPDMALYVTFLPPLPVAGGGEVVERDWHDWDDPDRPSSLFGPDGWLPDGVRAGSIVACRVEDGTLTVTEVAEDELDDEAAARVADHLRATFDAIGGTNSMGGPLDAPELLMETVARFPAVFRRAIVPVGELLEQAGVVVDGDAVLDPDAPDGMSEAAFLTEVYGLDEHEVEALRILMGAIELFERDALEELPAETAANVLMMLDPDAAVAEALADLELGILGAGTSRLERLVRLVRPHARGRAAAPLELLTARTAEAREDALAGEAALRKAVQLAPGLAAAHEDLAWYLEDRGDVAAALRHLRLAGVDGDDAQVQRLLARQAARPNVGRNDPCPCGSGAKYKRCCERTGGPLPDRVSALFDKLAAYLSRPLQRGEMLQLVEARAGDATDDARLAAAIGDGLVYDVALFEDGWLEDFLVARGVLLPDDERRLLASWEDLPRSLHEVVEVAPGEGLVLLDLRSGERVAVRERTASTQLQAGMTLFARVVPDGVGHQLSMGTVQIPVAQRAAMLAFLGTEPSAAEMCAWVASLEGPPTLLTMEGEPTVLCTAEYRVANPEQAAAALAERYEADPEHQTFIDWVEVGGRRWGRGTVSLEGDRLEVATNAVARLERFQAVIGEVVEGAELLDESRQALAEVAAAAGRSGPASPEDLPPELRDALEAEIRRHEQAWVDESIPMFGGLTPKQALADPTRREQVLAFLAEIGDQEVPGQMSARRIRQLLGLGLL